MKLCVITESGKFFFKLTMPWRLPSAYPAIPWDLTSLTLIIQHFGHHNSLWIINKENQLTHSREKYHRT